MEETKDFKHIVRVANTDLDGNKQILYALRKIKGVNSVFANAVCILAGIEKDKKTGVLADAQIKKLDDVIKNPQQHKIPEWMHNRRRDPETGEMQHLVGPNIDFAKETDIKKLRRIKCYRGVRHSAGLPVRGQRTKSNFRESKKKGKGGALGVAKRKGVRGGRV